MIKRLACAAIVAAGMVFAAQTFAGPLEDGQAAYGRGEFAAALGLWTPLADQGQAAAQLSVGRLYDNGEGVAQDYAEAMKWYRLAADQGNAEAQFAVGFMYEMGHGMFEDLVEAVKWYKLAAPTVPEAATRLAMVTQRLMSDPDGPG